MKSFINLVCNILSTLGTFVSDTMTPLINVNGELNKLLLLKNKFYTNFPQS